MSTQLTVQLMYQGQANQALALYADAIPCFTLVRKDLFGPEGPGKEGSVQEAVFAIGNTTVHCIDSPVTHGFDFTPSTSLCLTLDDRPTVERVFAALAKKGKSLMPLDDYGFNPCFGWLQDRFGVSWQISLKSA
ncbi:VOC family protein [Alcanivorax jadensis]|uniref:VOC family protein n=1 Tax=Alcanivorax jadensis TaxID=64988 RepID=UPI003569DB7D